MSDSPSGTTDSPAPATAPDSTPVSTSRDVAPAAESATASRGGDATDSTAPAGRSSVEAAPSPIAEATIEPPRIPGPRPETGNIAPTVAEATIPPAPLPSFTHIATEGFALHGSDTSSPDHPGEVGSVPTATAQQDVARPVAEATYIPPPVRDLGAQGADQTSTVGRGENDTQSAASTTDAAIHTDTQDHNDAGGSGGDTGVAQSPGARPADDAAPPGTAAATGSLPTTDTVVAAPLDGNSGVDQTVVPDLGDSDTIWSEGPDPTNATPRENGTVLPGQQHASAGSSDRPADGMGATGMLMPDAAGTTATSGLDTQNGLPAGEPVSDTAIRALTSGDTEAEPPPEPVSTGASVDGSSTASEPSTPDTGSHDSVASGTAVDQSTGSELSAGQDAGDADTVQRYSSADLGALVGIGSDTNHALYEGPDGKRHAVGDEIGRGLHRDKTGRLRDAKGYVNDDNKLPSKDIDAHAERGQSLDRMPVPTDSDQVDQIAALHAATLDRTEKLAAKNEIWVNQVEPLIDTLQEAGLTIDRNTFASAKFRDDLDDAAPSLPRNVLVATRVAAADYALASRGLVEASETLGTVGGKVASSLLYPDGHTITSSDGTRGVKETLDRTLYDGSGVPTLIIVEEKGGGSTLGVARVSDPNNPGEKIIAQQCSPEYVHHLLENDATLAAALHADPQLYQNVQLAIDGSSGGIVECLLVHTSAEGVVNVVPCRLDPSRFRRGTIRIPPNEGTL